MNPRGKFCNNFTREIIVRIRGKTDQKTARFVYFGLCVIILVGAEKIGNWNGRYTFVKIACAGCERFDNHRIILITNHTEKKTV